jgi:hypothetical protein
MLQEVLRTAGDLEELRTAEIVVLPGFLFPSGTRVAMFNEVSKYD